MSVSRRSSGPVIRSISPSPRSSPYTSSSLNSFNSSSPSIRFSLLDRPISPSRSISTVRSNSKPISVTKTVKRTCMCSPTTHPGSFRCSLHKNNNNNNNNNNNKYGNRNNGLNARRSAMTNSLVRIGTVEGEIVKRALTALIRPSSHHQRRRGVFQPRMSRLSVMSKIED